MTHVTCDTYRDTRMEENQSKVMKESQCEKGERDVSDKLVIRSPNFWVLAEFQKFLNKGGTKERLFEVIEQV